MMPKLLLVLAFALLLNLPFGYWRQGLRKLSVPWFLAIHLPIPFIIAFRIAMKLPLPWYGTVPLVIGSAVAGQLVGGRFRKR